MDYSQHKDRADSMGLLGEPENGKTGYMRNVFKACIHGGDYQRTHVAEDCTLYIVCEYENREREAQKTGLTLIRRGTNKSHGPYVF